MPREEVDIKPDLGRNERPEITLFIPIQDAPIWVLLLSLLLTPKVTVKDGQAIQYYEIFGKKYWSRQFKEPKDNAYKAEQQLKELKARKITDVIKSV